ncbi:MAG: VCBS repeat-containing protein, partial [Draconibacterium sp.]|nr:VCBS repeat-containing protein [Draconibacterium sp.]
NTDLYITNGIPAATNNLDYIGFISNRKIQMRLSEGMNSEDMDLINKIPDQKTNNFFFQNQGNLRFLDKSSTWAKNTPSYSNSAISADFDNDGDLDLIVNNINEKAFLLENRSEKVSENNQYLKVSLSSNGLNNFATGAKVLVYSKEKILTRENFHTVGYLSGSAAPLHFGLGTIESIDSIVVIWPDGSRQLETGIERNQEIVIQKNTMPAPLIEKIEATQQVELYDTLIVHSDHDFPSMEFIREPLALYQNSSPGPVMAVADVNNDGLDDLYIGGSKRHSGSLFLQNPDGEFIKVSIEAFEEDKQNEDSYAIFIDGNNDPYPDLIIGSGGNEFTSGEQLALRYYRNEEGRFVREKDVFRGFEQNVSTIQPADFNGDGLTDIFVGVSTVPGSYGKTPPNFLFENQGNNNFRDVTSEIAPELQNLGMVFDAAWTDLNNDKKPDLVLVGHYMPITVFLNHNDMFKKDESISGLEDTYGFWNEVEIADMNNDGKPDIIAGNWGLNSKLRASKEEPIQLYLADFDNNGSSEPILTYFNNGEEVLFANKDELESQLPFINKMFPTYSDFAKAELNDVFPKKSLANAEKKKVNMLQSAIFINNGKSSFTKNVLPVWAQFAPLWTILPENLNDDGVLDLLVAGNTFGLNTQLGRMDALKLTGLISNPDNSLQFERSKKIPLISGEIRDLKKIKAGDKEYFLVGVNNDSLKSFRIK